MESLRKTKWQNKPVILAVFLMLITIGCIDDLEFTGPAESDNSAFSGVQTVIITNSSGTLIEIDRRITATISYPAEGKIEITMCEQIDGNQKECRLEGNINNGSIIVSYLGKSTNSKHKSEGNANRSFEEYFGLGNIIMEDECPEWSGMLYEGKLELSCDFCCSIPGIQDLAEGEISCSLDRM